MSARLENVNIAKRREEKTRHSEWKNSTAGRVSRHSEVWQLETAVGSGTQMGADVGSVELVGLGSWLRNAAV